MTQLNSKDRICIGGEWYQRWGKYYADSNGRSWTKKELLERHERLEQRRRQSMSNNRSSDPYGWAITILAIVLIIGFIMAWRQQSQPGYQPDYNGMDNTSGQ